MDRSKLIQAGWQKTRKESIGSNGDVWYHPAVKDAEGNYSSRVGVQVKNSTRLLRLPVPTPKDSAALTAWIQAGEDSPFNGVLMYY